MRAQRPRIEFSYQIAIPVCIPQFSYPRPRGMTPPRLSTQYNALHYTMHDITTTLHYITIYYIRIRTPQYTILHYSTLQHTTLHDSTVQYITLQDSTVQQYSTGQLGALAAGQKRAQLGARRAAAV